MLAVDPARLVLISKLPAAPRARAPVADLVNVPELVTVTAPAVAKLSLRLKSVPFRLAEPTDTVPAKVVVPVAGLVWVRAPVMATAPLKLVVPALVTVTAVRPVASATPPAPNTPARFTEPVPAFSVR